MNKTLFKKIWTGQTQLKVKVTPNTWVFSRNLHKMLICVAKRPLPQTTENKLSATSQHRTDSAFSHLGCLKLAMFCCWRTIRFEVIYIHFEYAGLINWSALHKEFRVSHNHREVAKFHIPSFDFAVTPHFQVITAHLTEIIKCRATVLRR